MTRPAHESLAAFASLVDARDALAALHDDARRTFFAARGRAERLVAACQLAETGVALSHLRRVAGLALSF